MNVLQLHCDSVPRSAWLVLSMQNPYLEQS